MISATNLILVVCRMLLIIDNLFFYLNGWQKILELQVFTREPLFESIFLIHLLLDEILPYAKVMLSGVFKLVFNEGLCRSSLCILLLLLLFGWVYHRRTVGAD